MEEFLYDLEVQELTAYLREVQGRNIKVVAIGFSDALARIDWTSCERRVELLR